MPGDSPKSKSREIFTYPKRNLNGVMRRLQLVKD